MGCSGSKVDELPLVIRCRERKDLIRAAADHRYALAAAHVAYFHSMKDVGDALRRFVEEELILAANSSTSSSTPTTTSSSLHSLKDNDEEEQEQEKEQGQEEVFQDKKLDGLHRRSKIKGKTFSRSKIKGERPEEVSGSGTSHFHRFHGGDDSDSHLHLSSDESDVSQIHDLGDVGYEDMDIHRDPFSDPGPGPYSNGYGYGYVYAPPYGGYGMTDPAAQGAYSGQYPTYVEMNQPYQAWAGLEHTGMNFQNNSNIYYMRNSSPAVQTVIHRPEPVMNGYTNPYYGYPMQNEGFYGYQPGPPPPPPPSVRPEKEKLAAPPPPPPPKASAWDFFNPFDEYGNGYSGNEYHYGVGHEYVSSSPDSTEVRMREGIPDLEEETEYEAYKKAQKGSKRFSSERHKWSDDRPPSDSVPKPGSAAFSPPKKDEGSSSSEAISLHKSSSENSTKVTPLRKGITRNLKKMPNTSQAQQKHRTVPTLDLTEEDSSHETVDKHVRKKGVSFEVDETIKSEIESSKMSSFATLSAHGSRDLREVVAEIRDEFAVAYDNGKEVAVMLDVGKLPYQPNFIRVILSRILYLISPSLSSSYPPSIRSIKLAAKTMKLAKSYFGDDLKDIELEPCNLLSTLEKLYAWEKKLYKEVKNEERLRVAYDKQCKRLTSLDQRGAESSKIDHARSLIRKLLTRLNVSIKSIDAISNRIQKLRDDELYPQVAKLIYGMIRMWRSMLLCHQKQFQAIKESKLRALRAKTDSQNDSTLRGATCDLEMELRLWCGHFNNWISTQKAYVESLNGWLMKCLEYEPEETPDGPVPFSPGRLGAPPIFVICHDWKLAMEMISETGVANAMETFASSLRNLWEKQDEEQRQRLRADDLSEDFRNRLKNNTTTTTTTTGGGSLVTSPPVDLDTVQKRLAEERAKHKDAIKILNYAASSSVQGGLVPIFMALESFSMEALKAHEQVRLQDEDN